jgi:hypothetical protein
VQAFGHHLGAVGAQEIQFRVDVNQRRPSAVGTVAQTFVEILDANVSYILQTLELDLLGDCFDLFGDVGHITSLLDHGGSEQG